MTEKTEEPRSAMQALDEALAAGPLTDEAYQPDAAVDDRTPEQIAAQEAIAEQAADGDEMPPGHEQLDETANKKAHWKFRRVAYSMTLLGLILLPLTILIRTGRWSMRNLVAHDRGWEFGPW